MRYYIKQKKWGSWIFLSLLFLISIPFFEPITKKINTYIYYETNIIDGKIFNLYHRLPDLEWFYEYQNQLPIFLAILSFSALFIAPLNSINNTIKDGNLLQVTYIRDRFNYSIVGRYLFLILIIIVVGHFILTLLILFFIVTDIFIFYRRYANFIFKNNRVMVRFLSSKIREENKTRSVFLETFIEVKDILARFEKKHKNLTSDYNTSITLVSRLGVQEVDKGKLKSFLTSANHKINFYEDKKTSYKKFSYFRSSVFFDFRDFKISLVLDYKENKTLQKSDEYSESITASLQNEFYRVFDYLKKNHFEGILPYLMSGLDVYFFDLYKKNEFRVLFSTIDLMQEAISQADLRIGSGVFDVLDFFHKIFNDYKTMNTVPVFNEKIYQLWLAVFKKSISLDKNVIEFHFSNFCFGLEKGFINKLHLQKFNLDIKTALLQSENSLHSDFIFAFFNSLLKIAVSMSWTEYDYANQFAKKIAYFGEEIFFDANLKITPENREQSQLDSKQGLFLLAAYCLQQKKKNLCIKSLALLRDDTVTVFLQFAENEVWSQKWQWEQWFKEEKADSKILQKINLRDFVCYLLLFYLKNEKKASSLLKQQNYKKEHLNYLERLHILCNQKNRLKITLKKILQDTFKKEIQSRSVAILEEKKLELFKYCNEEYKSENKLADFIKFNSVLFKDKRISNKKRSLQWILAKKNFLGKKALILEDYDHLAENLLELEHRHCLQKICSVLNIKHISYKELFIEIIPKLLEEEGVNILFFGDSYKIRRFFESQGEKNQFLLELSLQVSQKKVFFSMHNKDYDYLQTRYWLIHNLEKRAIYFLPYVKEKGIFLFIYKKRDKFKLVCNTSQANLENQQTGHINYELNSPSLNSKIAENFFKNENLHSLSDTEKKAILLNNFTFKITSSLDLSLPKSQQLFSKVYHITR